MAISERVDLVGNVSAQARKWARDLAKLSAQAKALNRAMGGGGGRTTQDKVVSAQARAERAKAAAIKAQARATAQAAREQAKLSKAQFGPGRREAGASAAQRHREEARARTSAARSQAAATKAQARAEASAARQRQKAANDNARALSKQEAAAARASAKQQAQSRKGDYRYTLKRTETGGMGGMVNSAVGNFAADAAMNAMSTLAGLMQSMASTFVQAQKFREQSLAGLTLLTKSGGEAKKVWDESFKLARETGSTQQETMASIQTLMARGFKSGEAAEMFRIMSAFTTVNPAANIEAITTAISQIRAKGKLTAEELHGQLGEQLNVGDVYDILARKLKTDKAGVVKMMAAGQIDSQTGIDAVKEAMVKAAGGDVSKALALKSGGLGSILSRLQSAPMTFFAGLEQDPALMEKMKGSLSGLVDLLDPSTEKGKKAAGSFAKMIDVIAGPGADLFAKMADGAPEFLESITKVSTDLAPILSLLGAIAGAALKVQSSIASGLGALAGLSETIWTYFNQAISQFSTAGSTMASNLVSGLVNGIFGGQSSIVAAITSMATTAIGAGNAAFAIHSPSRVFAAMGEMLPAGLARGVMQNMAVVEQSARAMAGGATTATQSALPFIGRAMADVGAGAVNKTISMGGVRQQNVFNLGSERDGAAAEISALQKRMIQAEIQAFFGKAAAAA